MNAHDILNELAQASYELAEAENKEKAAKALRIKAQKRVRGDDQVTRAPVRCGFGPTRDSVRQRPFGAGCAKVQRGAAPLANERILVIEDDPSVRTL